MDYTLDDIKGMDGKVYTLSEVNAMPAAITTGKAINGIPRQLGLTARYGLEGIAQAGQVFTEPVAALMRLGGVKTKSMGEMASGLADSIGLPTPQGANERVIGDATRLVAGAGGMAGVAGKIGGLASNALQFTGQGTAPVAQSVGAKVVQGMATNPAQQISSAAGAGLMGGSSREAGGDGWQQAGAAMLGGVAGGMVPGLASGAANLVGRWRAPELTVPQLDIKLTETLAKAGADYSKLPGQVQRQLRAELATSLQAGKELNPQAVSRLADFRAVGATPTRGMVSQNPVQITREMNLAKIGANSADDSLHGMPMIQNQNNTALIGRLNEYGGRSETLPIAAGRMIQDRVQGTNAALGAAEQGAWDTAKGLPGYKAPIYPDALNAAIKRAGDDGLVGFLPKQITDYMEVFQTGQQPFTPQHYKNLRSLLSGELAKGGNEAAAARAAINGMDSVPMRPITNAGGIDLGTAPVTQGVASALRGRDAQAGDAIGAIDRARAATAAKYNYQESSPLVRTALSDARTADPEKLAQSFILNGTVNDARAVAQEVGAQGMATIRDTLATHIKKQALSGASDETGKVSQSALNAVLNKIGDEKLRMFFSPEEVAGLRATGRVASLMQSQPAGSAVNNSNSGALLLGRGLDFLDKTPFLGPMVGPALKNIDVSMRQRQAQNYLPGLLATNPKTPMLEGLMLPGLAFSGGLLAP